MTIQFYMHWFWITKFSLYYNVVLPCIFVYVILTPDPILTEAGLQTNVNISSQYNLTYQNSATLQDIFITTSSPVATTNNPQNETLLKNKVDKTSDIEDTFNGGNSDVYYPYPIKKYTKHVDKSRYKSKLVEEDSNKSLYKSKNVEIFQEKINLSFKADEALPTVESWKEDEGETTVENHSISGNTSGDVFLNDEPIDGNSTLDQVTDVVHNSTNLVAESTSTVEPSDVNKIVAAATSAENKEHVHHSGLDVGSITGIVLGIVVICALFGATSFVLYRRRYLNKPQALNDKSSNLDSSGYIDDTSLRVSQISTICMGYKENSEEMYSLDNDSFLNSLEAMTIQNYWTENVKHTKL